LHTLHLATPPALFYIICGLIFVITGGALSGLVLNRSEIRSVATARYPYFAAYAVLAYVVLIAFGAEVFVASSLTWMVGALMGNILGFEAMTRLRHAAT
jgi:ribulose 1,5-bisphosphate carboxylase large subunit-like protein